MNQTGWNPPTLKFIRVKILLIKRIVGWNPSFFLKHRFHILYFPNLTGLFTKPTARQSTKYWFSPDIDEVNPCNLNCWEHGSWDLPLHAGLESWVPTRSWMPTWWHVLEVRLGTRVASWVKPNGRLDAQRKSHKYCCITQARSDFNDS